MNRSLKSYSRIVIKIGSSLLVQPGIGLRRQWMDSLVADVAEMAQKGHQMVIVSSGAIAFGRRELGKLLPNRNLKLEESQAAAAVGQIALCRAYAESLATHGITAGQILLTLGDTETRRRYLNARSTIESLLKWKSIPIVNENDSVATNEIRYGDNDRLAARVASMVGADLLILLLDVDGLFTAAPHLDPNAEFIPEVTSISREIEGMAGEAASGLSRGGMKTKIQAAKIATAAGTTMVIGSGQVNHPLKEIENGARSTWFAPSPNPINDRKKWIAGGLEVSGAITVDAGALIALEAGKSLLPAGVTAVTGNFSRGDTVDILGPHGHKIGRGLIEYDAIEANKIVGLKSSQIETFLGPTIRTEMIHRDDLVLDS